MSETALIICRWDELGGKTACWPVGSPDPSGRIVESQPARRLADCSTGRRFSTRASRRSAVRFRLERTSVLQLPYPRPRDWPTTPLANPPPARVPASAPRKVPIHLTPCRTAILWKEDQSICHPKEPDNQGITTAFGQRNFHIRELSIRAENRFKQISSNLFEDFGRVS